MIAEVEPGAGAERAIDKQALQRALRLLYGGMTELRRARKDLADAEAKFDAAVLVVQSILK